MINKLLHVLRKIRLPVIICDPIVDGVFEGRLDREHLSAEEVYRIYFPIWNSNINTYCLIIADLSERQLLYIDPRVDSSLPQDTRGNRKRRV